jgi:hypothetical protein
MREVQQRPEPDHALREMPLEGLESARERLDNAILRAQDQCDVGQARLYARQQDRIAAELLARRLERQEADREAAETGAWEP